MLRPDCVGSTFAEILRHRAHHQADHRALVFLPANDGEPQELSYGELDRRARLLGSRLAAHVPRGARALLVCPPGLDYVVGLVGCLYAGVIAVPVFPPDPARLERTLPRLRAIAADAQAGVMLSTTAIAAAAPVLFAQAPDLAALPVLIVSNVPDDEVGWHPAASRPEAPALLQYTSGSTGTPKGVVLSHANLLHNSEMLRVGIAQHAVSSWVSWVSWLPPYHDMGLIAGLLQPLYLGTCGVLMAPLAFLQRPMRWLEAIAHYRGRVSGGPNFAYDLCVRRSTPEQRAAIDLSCWEVAFSGAEPVRAETLARFRDAFAPAGFRPEAFVPAYGLAEATLLVACRKSPALAVGHFDKEALAHGTATVGPADDGTTQTQVGCGHTVLEQRLEIVDPEARTVCPPGRVGEIWVQGPSIAGGYWGRAEETARTFHARLVDTGEGPFLRTGDLGFVHDGELFIAGRLKDLIIIHGRNHYPQDIELTAEQAHPAVRPGCGAAFSVEIDGEERLVVAVEFERRHQPDRRKMPGAPASHADRRGGERRQDDQDVQAFVADQASEERLRALRVSGQPASGPDPDEVLSCIRQAIVEHHEVQPYAVALLKAGTIHKTSSGKIQRRACKQSFLESSLDLVRIWRADALAPTGAPAVNGGRDAMGGGAGASPDTTRWLRARLGDILGVDPAAIDADYPITGYGLDSIKTIELQSDIERRTGVVLPVAKLLRGPSLRELAGMLRAGRRDGSGAGAPELLAVAGPSGEHPLSNGQRALWFLQQLAPASAAYNLARAVRLPVDVDLDALQGAWQGLSDRHAVLRTTLPARDGEPVQRVAPPGTPVAFSRVDGSGWSDARLSAWLVAEAHRAFDLARGPLVRIVALTGIGAAPLLLFVAHHTVVDLWSFAVMMEELAVLYAAARRGEQAVLPAVALQYADYARWQQALLAGSEGERLWAYWRAQLAGAPPSLDLATDRPRPPTQTFVGASRTARLGVELSEQIKAQAQARGVTPFVLLLAAFEALLSRYTGQRDLVVGSPSAGRERAALAGVVGYFVNTLPLRARIDPEAPFATLLDQVHGTVLAALEHATLPFQRMVERLAPVRDPSRSPLVQVTFALQKAPRLEADGLALLALDEAGARLELAELPLEAVPIEQRYAQFDLSLMMAEGSSGFVASLEYNTDLFDADTAAGLLAHFRNLLAGAVADPDQAVGRLPLLAAAERERLLVAWNATRVDTPAHGAIHEWVAAQAAHAPDAAAVVFGTEVLTYRALARRAAQLANRLRELGVTRGTLVGVCMERSLELIVALLGVLQAGGAYVPLDPTYPSERLAFTAADAALRVVVAQPQTRAASGVLEGATVFELDSTFTALDGAPSGALDLPVGPEDLAYVIYTSGSMGQPKGVAIPHGALVRSTAARLAYYAEPPAAFLLLTSFAFDSSVAGIFWTLCTGSTLVLPDQSEMENPSRLLRLAARTGVTHLLCVPSLYQALLDEVEQTASPSCLRVAIVAGEVLSSVLAARHHAALPGARLYNEYGPTEGTVWSTAQFVAGDEIRSPVPIGRPVGVTDVYVLDPRAEPAPVGVPGDLFLGGAGLAQGYLGRPELTAERFVPDPFSATPGARMYRTGDRARWLSDGTLQFLGRLDDQVKVRGHRIELGEVEARIADDLRVREVAVVVREDHSGRPCLVAYVVGREGAAPPAAETRASLARVLPGYMLPAVFVALDALPRLPNGKVDRKALPAPDELDDFDRAFVAPRTAVEVTLANAWREVLRRPRVGVFDNFFEIGGDSILSIQVVARAARSGLHVTPRQLLQHPTVAALAQVVQPEPKVVAEQGLVEGAAPLVPAQRWMFARELPNPSHFNQAVLLEVGHDLDARCLAAALEALVAHHDTLRLRYVRGANGWTQHYERLVHEGFPLARVDLGGLPHAEQKATLAQVCAATQAQMDLVRGPIARAVLFDFGAGQPGRLLLAIHHLAVDTVSWRVLLEDLATAYRQCTARRPVALPPKTTAFKTWAERLESLAASDSLRAELPYWLGLPWDRVGTLPVDAAEGAGTVGAAKTVMVALDVTETEALLALVPSVYHTQINDALLAALGRALGDWAGTDTMLIDLEGHGREPLFDDVDLSCTVGWFTAVFPAVLSRHAARDWGEALIATRAALQAIPRRGVGYWLLRYLGDAETSAQLAALPSPDVAFNYMGQLDGSLGDGTLFRPAPELPGPTIDPAAPRSNLVEINAHVLRGRLEVFFTYSPRVHSTATIEALAERYTAALRSLSAHCGSTQAGG